MTEQYLDVSDMEPPEPLEQALAALATLGEGDYLRLLHRREPFPLYGLLDQHGFRWHTRPGKSADFDIFIWRQDDDKAEAAVQQALG